MRLLFLILFLATTRCGDYQEYYNRSTVVDTQGFSTLSFAAMNAIIFNRNVLTVIAISAAYANVLPLVQLIRTKVASDAMPQGGPPLIEGEKTILFAWIDAGAPQTSEIPLPKEAP